MQMYSREVIIYLKEISGREHIEQQSQQLGCGNLTI